MSRVRESINKIRDSQIFTLPIALHFTFHTIYSLTIAQNQSFRSTFWSPKLPTRPLQHLAEKHSCCLSSRQESILRKQAAVCRQLSPASLFRICLLPQQHAQDLTGCWCSGVPVQKQLAAAQARHLSKQPLPDSGSTRGADGCYD